MGKRNFLTLKNLSIITVSSYTHTQNTDLYVYVCFIKYFALKKTLIKIKDKEKVISGILSTQISIFWYLYAPNYPKNDVHNDQKVLPNLEVPSESPKIKLECI